MCKLEQHNTFPIPSFSSTLLDQIYNSIDEGKSKSTETKFYRETTTTTTTMRQKHWTEKTDYRKDNNNNNNKNVAVVKEKDNRKSHHDHDDPESVLFFSSTSISSDTSSGGFSSSDTDSASWRRPVRTSASFRWENEKKQGKRVLEDDCSSFRDAKQSVTDEKALIKSKSRALKIYNNLKKMKQPISPGGKLTSFLNSLFATGNSKKKNDIESERKVNSGQASSTCCSASSFSRSCLSKVSSCDREQMSNGVKRTVRFYPVVVEEEKSKVVEKAAREFLREYHQNNQKKKNDLVLNDSRLRININYVKEEDEDEDYDDDDDDDAASCASSDLFELDHLGVYDEELPVFETTRFSTNRAIANGLRVK